MENKRPLGLTLIGIFEFLVGLFWSFLLVFSLSLLLAFHKRITAGPGLLITIVWSLFLFLGLGILQRNRVALIMNKIILPAMLFISILTLVASWIGVPYKGGIIFVSVSVIFIVLGVIILVYLSNPKIKEQFK